MSARDHNQIQRDYYAGPVRPALIPADTPYVRRHIREVLEAVRPADGEKILEVGCGMGRFTLPLAAGGLDMEGLDLSPELLDRFRGYAGHGPTIPLHCADLLEPPGTLHGRFDLVIGFFALHHIRDLNACFHAIHRLLRPGGRVAFAEPNAWNPLFYLQILFTANMTWAADGGIARMRPGIVFPAMRQAGFTSPAVSRYGFFPPRILAHPAGARLEPLLEKRFPLRALLPFQVFSAWCG